MRAWVAAVVATAVAGGAAQAQRIDDARAAVVSRRAAAPADSSKSGWVPDSVAADSSRNVVSLLRASPRARSVAPLVSLVAPGGGQLILGDNRFIAYAAVELLGWLKYRKDSHEQAQQEASFRDLARKVARSGLSSQGPDGNWTYYEAMRDWKRSGDYTTETDGTVVPTSDATTFNGNQWLLALRTNPDSASALAQYERQAYKSDLEWSWENASIQWDIFKRTTFKRDDAHYAGVQDLIVIGANHFLSMVDAFATLRLSVHTDPAGRTSVGASLRW